MEPDPKIPDWLQGVWRAWHRLNADRPWNSAGMAGMMPGPIPWRDVVAWCDFHNLTGEDVAFYDTLIRAMDGEFLAWHAARQPKLKGKS
jgi:hypothetical protein